MSAKDRIFKLINGYCRMESNNMNIVSGIIGIIYEYHRPVACWSKEFKGDSIELMDNDTKAYCKGTKEGQSVRADFSIKQGEIVSWEVESYQSYFGCYFYGVISSKQQKFDSSPSNKMDHAYGVDDYEDTIYLGEREYLTEWDKPKLPRSEIFILKMTADWRGKQCKLLIFFNEEKLNDTDNECTILLPILDDDEILYPCVTPYNKDAYCIIRFA